MRRLLLLAPAALLLACGGGGARDGNLETPAPGVASRAASPADSLPAAILGTAPPPRGAALHYVEGDSATTGYVVAPEGEGPFPAVLLIHEWDGLGDRVRQVADALADEGYVALAVDLYQGRTGASQQENRALVTEARANPARLIANLDAAARALRARPDVTGRVAAMGWCFGGGVALSWGIGGERHEGTAIFYGQLVTDPAELARLHHPVYGTFAAEDQGIPPDEVARFVDALRTAGVENDVHVYDDVGHGFWLYVEEDPAARTAPAADAWRRLLAYLDGALRTE